MVGTGTAGDLTFHVNARSAPDGSNASGTMWWRSPQESFHADITCLNVVGNTATIGGEVTQSDFLEWDDTGVLFWVTDNGEPGDQDLWGGTFLLTPPGDSECAEQVPGSAEQTGNFVVHDATP